MRRLIFGSVFALGATKMDRQRLGFGEQVKIYNRAVTDRTRGRLDRFYRYSVLYFNVKLLLKHGMCP